MSGNENFRPDIDENLEEKEKEIKNKLKKNTRKKSSTKI